jgi:hypothetical protein
MTILLWFQANIRLFFARLNYLRGKRTVTQARTKERIALAGAARSAPAKHVFRGQ